jgi:hypothetical protein
VWAGPRDVDVSNLVPRLAMRRSVVEVARDAGLSARMKLLVHASQIVPIDMRVDLRR